MRKCRCCRTWWPPECYGGRYATCQACRTNCGRHYRRRAVARTREWKARLASEVAAIREQRAAVA